MVTPMEIATEDDADAESKELPRNLFAFWIIGLCNNFGYVVMLSGAYDILGDQMKGNIEQNVTSVLPKNSTKFHCNPTSTGVILLADILPCLLIKLTAPFYMQLINYHLRIGTVIILISLSLVTVAFSPNVGVSIFGVVLASISSGLGEITFLGLSSHFKASTVSTWSSGTGMAGVTGSFAYAALLQLGLTKRNTLLVLLVVPFVWSISVWGVLKFPPSLKYRIGTPQIETNVSVSNENTCDDTDRTKHLPFKEKIKLVQPLLKYMVPLFLVYFAEYTINQGIYEILYYENSRLSQSEQYRWYQVDYQVAVFLSRSSVYLFRINRIYLAAIAQWIILTVLLFELYYSFIPSIWITLVIIFFEGLLGGAVYVNAFFRISREIPPDTREFSMGAASVSDSCGITVAGAISIPIHNAFCKLKTK